MRNKFMSYSLYKQKVFNSLSDRWLVKKAKEGDKEAFGKLYLKYLDAIYRYIFFKINQDKEQAEDLTEIVFFKAWDKINNFDEGMSGFKPWIYRIAHNTVIDYFRQKKEKIALDESLYDDTQDLEMKVHLSFESRKIMKAIKKLPVAQKEALTMKYIDELSNKEISEAMKKKEGAIRVLQYRALKALKELLNEDEK